MLQTETPADGGSWPVPRVEPVPQVQIAEEHGRLTARINNGQVVGRELFAVENTGDGRFSIPFEQLRPALEEVRSALRREYEDRDPRALIVERFRAGGATVEFRFSATTGGTLGTRTHRWRTYPVSVRPDAKLDPANGKRRYDKSDYECVLSQVDARLLLLEVGGVRAARR